jgi:hypothetical protein
LAEVLVGKALHSCLGGNPEDFNVIACGLRSFRFSVASRNVGFLVYQLLSYSRVAFKCFFHLWGNGGANWQKEFRDWQKECQQEWTLVSPNKRRTDSALLALKKKPVKPSLKSRANDVSRKLSFAVIEVYPVCQGYEYPVTEEQAADLLQAGYECPQLQRRAGVVFSPKIVQSDQSISFGSLDKNIVDQVL